MVELPRPGESIYLDPWVEPLRVYEVRELAGRIRLGVIFTETGRAQTFLLKREELASRLRYVLPLAETFRSKQGPLRKDDFLLFLEAFRLRLGYLFDPHYAVSVSQVDFLPHQVDAVYRYILPLPQIRFLLADDPGLGKTIMAGLVLKELKARGTVKQCLIVVPAHLQNQWRRELRDWFREEFTILDRPMLSNIASDYFFERNPQLITSMDFAARNEKTKETLTQRSWDLVIVDEAHKLSATRYGAKIYKTKRYQLGEDISPKAKNLLFLTATPHKGDEVAYFLLLDLLEPRLFADEVHLKRMMQGGWRPPFILRRSKEQVTDLNGNKLFKKRDVSSLSVTMTEVERRLYEAVTSYVRRWYQVLGTDEWLAFGRRRRNIALALTVLQRRVTSSLAAIRESLRRRRQKLEVLRVEWEHHLEEELPELDEESRTEVADETANEWENFQERLEGLTAARTLEELREEIEEINNLIGLAIEAEKGGEEAKVQELRQVVEERLRHQREEKLLIFSEFKDTVFALRNKLASWGFPVAVIHGGMDMPEREEQERIFRDRVQVMVATDAAAEGINLQFCRFMIDFDLPWNPNRLEQRMGRIHRYGQNRDCFIWNLLYSDTREGQVLEILLKKLERMRERPELGDTIYDVIGTLLEGVHLEDLIMEALMKGDTTEVEKVIEVGLEQRVEEFTQALRDSALAGYYIDLSAVVKDEEKSTLQRVVPYDVEFFTSLAAYHLRGALEPDSKQPGVFHLGIPLDLQREFRDKGYVAGLRIAFERLVARSANAEFFAPGHPVLEKLVDRFIEGGQRPRLAVLGDPQGSRGSLWLFRECIKDGNDQPVIERVLALFHDHDSNCNLTLVDPRWVRDLKEVSGELPIPEELLANFERIQLEAVGEAADQLDSLLAEARERREREVNIKLSCLKNSYDAFISESESKLSGYRRRQQRGQDMRLAIQQEEANLKTLNAEKVERLQALPWETQFTLLQPELEAVALIVPVASFFGGTPSEEAKEREEQAGVEFVMRYERQQGREPEDVSKKKLGYDVESAGGTKKRCIEVKSFASTGSLELTSNEWQMARRLTKDYWLYIVENAIPTPKLTAIQDPTAKLHPQEKWNITGFSFPYWKAQIGSD